MNERWLKAWEEGRTNFHLREVNPTLPRHGPEWLAGGAHRILVPLCGKSLDLPWLAAQGHDVIGAELSEIAVRALFAEAGREPEIVPGDPVLYRTPGLSVYQGDFFALRPEHLAEVGGPPDRAWDRAAMIALPPELRGPYVDHLRSLLAPGAVILLDTLAYDQARMSGPPFSVTEDEVRARYGGGARVELLERAALAVEERWKVHGHEWMHRLVFRITLP